MKKFLILFIILLGFLGLTNCVKAESASLYLSPSTGTFPVGETFNVSVFVNTNGNDVNAVRADIEFDPKKLQITSPTADKSFISVWVAQPTYSNILGTASFQGGLPSPGINTSSGLVSTIRFRVIGSGDSVISVSDSSKVFLNDGNGTDILTSFGKAEFLFKLPPPEGPEVFSSTHSDQNKWHRNNNVSFSWEKEDFVSDFSYSLDKDFYGSPDNVSEGSHTSVSFDDLEDGIWYFHIKAKKGGVWGGKSNYPVRIDTTPPADFSIELEFDSPDKSGRIITKEPIVSFITTDSLSGFDHFELKAIYLTETGAKEEAGFFIEAASPYRLPVLELGEYLVVVRAYDKAMNWREVSQKIEIAKTGALFYVTKQGIYTEIFGMRLSWNIIAIFLVIFIAVSAIVLYLWFRNYRILKRRSELLAEVKQKARENKEQFESKINDKK